MDPRGNRLAMFHNGVQTPYTYGDNNELTDAGGTGWDYDHFGNTVSMGAYDLTYDFESHVLTISAIVGASDIHEYDGDGRRMRSKLNGSSVWNHFVHDELTENILIEYQVPVNPNAKSLYTWGIGLISSTQVAVSEKRWFHFDGLGTTAALTDFNENITDTYEFSALGVLEGSTGSSVNPFRYVGQWGYYDDGARGSQYGLLLLGVRYYSRAAGRFLTWDPVPSMNPYLYVHNRSTLAIDPTGRLWVLLAVLIVAVAASGCGRNGGPRISPTPTGQPNPLISCIDRCMEYVCGFKPACRGFCGVVCAVFTGPGCEALWQKCFQYRGSQWAKWCLAFYDLVCAGE
jgi:RHS repeat-associated protein